MAVEPDSRARILEAATELFSARSYHAVTMDEIAKHAGVSKGGLFHHFSSKYELASEVLLASLGRPWRELVGRVQDIADPADRARLMIGCLVDMALGSHSLSRLTLDILAESMACDDGVDRWMPILHEIGHTMETVLDECGIPNPQTKAMVLIAAVDDLGMQVGFLGPDQGIDAEMLKGELYELFVGNYIER